MIAISAPSVTKTIIRIRNIRGEERASGLKSCAITALFIPEPSRFNMAQVRRKQTGPFRSDERHLFGSVRRRVAAPARAGPALIPCQRTLAGAATRAGSFHFRPQY